MINAMILKTQAEECYEHEFYYGSIFCIHAAITSLLSEKFYNPIKENGFREWNFNKLIGMVSGLNQDETLLSKSINLIRNNLAHPKDSIEFFYPHTKMTKIEGNSVRVLPENTNFFFSIQNISKSGIELFHRLLKLTSSKRDTG